MDATELNDLVGYDAWANARMVAAFQELSDEAFAAPAASSFGSVRDTFAHIVSAEWIWLRRWKGDSPTAPPAWLGSGSRAELLAQLAGVQKERAEFLAALPAGGLQTAISYRTLNGQAHTNALGDLVRHVVNHSTYHRGQVATQLRQLGRTPPSTDFVLYLRERG
ncbi:MAG: DinB family protein [Vicinamibacteria bacterium]